MCRAGGDDRSRQRLFQSEGAFDGARSQSFGRLKAAHDLVIVEGAGSPAEVNLRSGDIANMGFARAAGLPVVLFVIDRGGVIAQIVGTQAVLDPPMRRRLQASSSTSSGAILRFSTTAIA